MGKIVSVELVVTTAVDDRSPFAVTIAVLDGLIVICAADTTGELRLTSECSADCCSSLIFCCSAFDLSSIFSWVVVGLALYDSVVIATRGFCGGCNVTCGGDAIPCMLNVCDCINGEPFVDETVLPPIVTIDIIVGRLSSVCACEVASVDCCEPMINCGFGWMLICCKLCALAAFI